MRHADAIKRTAHGRQGQGKQKAQNNGQYQVLGEIRGDEKGNQDQQLKRAPD